MSNIYAFPHSLMLVKIIWAGLSCHTRSHRIRFYLILAFLCSAQPLIAKIPSCQSQLCWVTCLYLTLWVATASSASYKIFLQSVESWQLWAEEDGSDGAQREPSNVEPAMPLAPAKSQRKRSLPDRQQTFHASPQKHLAVSAVSRVSEAPTTIQQAIL